MACDTLIFRYVPDILHTLSRPVETWPAATTAWVGGAMRAGVVKRTRTDLRRLEELGLNASAPPEQLFYDGWLLRLLPGKVKRARSVNAVYPSRLPLAEKLAHCEQLYRDRGLPLIFRMTPLSEPASLDAELSVRAYPKFDTTAVESMPIRSPAKRDTSVQVLDLPHWVDVVARLRGSPADHRDTHLLRLMALGLARTPLALREGDDFVAAGLVIVEGAWAGLYDIVTDPSRLRQGLGRRISQSLLHCAWDMGAREAYLQVMTSNRAARTLYADLGFDERYHYWYRGPRKP